MVPSLGRVVLVNIGTRGDEVQLRPATVVRVWGDTPQAAINAIVQLDGSNDRGCDLLVARGKQDLDPGANPLVWLPSITPGDGLGNWRWSPRVG